MANSIFLGTLLGTSTGSSITPSLPIASVDGLVGAPGMTWANALTSGWYRNAANDFRWATAGVDVLQITSSAVNNIATGGVFQVPSAGSFSLGSTGFITATGTSGLFQIRNAALTAGVSLNVNTDGVMILRDRANAAFGTLDCLGLKASGVAGASFGPGAVASLTVVNGIVTAVS